MAGWQTQRTRWWAGLALTVILWSAPTLAQDPAALRNALEAAAQGRTSQIESLAANLDRLDRKLVDWVLARSGSVSADAITRFAVQNPTWPDPDTLRRRAEEALERENPPAAEVIEAFGSSRPLSTRGAMLLARAHLARGNRASAADIIRPAWRENSMPNETESAILGEFGSLLTSADHRARLDRALLKERADDAMQIARQLGSGWVSLVNARMAVERKAANAGKLLDAVPANLRDEPTYLFGRAQWARRTERWQEAAQLLLKAPRDPKAMVVPDEWWEEKRIVSRKILELGDARLAYRIVQGHTGSTRAKQAEAEFHAGWYALRFLRDPNTAMAHFKRVQAASPSPITRARGLYWQARAAEAGGGGNANELYGQAAKLGNTFYGMMARSKLGMSDLGLARPPQGDASGGGDERFTAIRRLAAAGRRDLAGHFFKHMGETLQSQTQFAGLIRLAESLGWYNMAVQTGKAAIQRDLDIELLAYPTAAVPGSADTGGLEKALAWAIMRQESEFNQGVVSTAGAVGIIQVMPVTGREAAKKLGIPYDAGRWRNDALYNLRLGGAYVANLIDNYDGNYVMAIAGYNAGPGRIREWVQRFGDPRDPSVDPIDWMEMIPFGETRNYVHRVLENLQIYRMKFDGANLRLAQDLRRGVGARGATAATRSVTTGSTPARDAAPQAFDPGESRN
jgi:soluble lytic murein transglycosylase